MASKKVLIGALLLILIIVIVAIVLFVVFTKKDSEEFAMGVASDNDLCTQIGADALRAGGGAVDSLIAVLLCLGAAQPQANGIGGGGFMVVYTKEASSSITFREMAPASSDENMFKEPGASSTTGGLAAGVPGEIMGYWTAHQKFGRLPWKDLFTPSIELLRTGIPVTDLMEKALVAVKDHMIKDRVAAPIFFTDTSDANSYIKVGQNFTNEALADTYELIANEGPDAFYKGEIAENIISRVNETGGIMTMEDLANYVVVEEDPFNLAYRGYDIISVPPPASGHVISLVLQILDRFDLASMDSLQAWNTILEAFRYGYAMRSQTGDKDFSTKTEWVVNKIRDGSWAKELEESMNINSTGYITPFTSISRYSDEVFTTYDGTHTTHVSILGPDGEAVSCTSTVNLYFGSRVMTDDGILLNNQMDDFSTPGVTNSFGYAPSPENFIAPGKRPLSSSSPSIVFDDQGRARFVSGAAGGSRIITGTLLSIINALDWEMSLSESLGKARIHDQLSTETLYENNAALGLTVDDSLLTGLRALGYNMTAWDAVPRELSYMSSVTSVSSLLGYTEASGDPRKEGTGAIVEQDEVDA